MIHTSFHPGGVILPVLAHPGSKRTAILGERAGALRVAVAAPPEKGKANIAIQCVLAEALACKASQITLLTGETSRRKRFLVGGMNAEELTIRLMPLLDEIESSRSRS